MHWISNKRHIASELTTTDDLDISIPHGNVKQGQTL